MPGDLTGCERRSRTRIDVSTGESQGASVVCARLKPPTVRPRTSRAGRSQPTTLSAGRELGSLMTIDMIVAIIAASIVAYVIAKDFAS